MKPASLCRPSSAPHTPSPGLRSCPPCLPWKISNCEKAKSGGRWEESRQGLAGSYMNPNTVRGLKDHSALRNHWGSWDRASTVDFRLPA